ncbi:S8 family peptidase [bacterium]|nr:S8 family peptidase [bacterium]
MFRKFVLTLLILLASGCTILNAAFPKYISGKMIITVKLDYTLSMGISKDGYVTTGIADIDDLNAEYEVTSCRNIFRSPRPDPRILERFRNSFVFVFANNDLDIEKVSSEFENLPQVRDAHPDWLTPYLRDTNDPLYGNQWYLRKIEADKAWHLTTGSEGVIIGALDSGVDWKHEDLAPVLWQNTYGGFGAWDHGEDIDMDGRTLEYIGGEWVFDPDDVNNADDDFNGYVDDFIGFDFIDDAEYCYYDDSLFEDCDSMENDPADFILDGHGTHVSGIMLAATNNEYGIAGINWQGELMCLRSGYYLLDPETMEASGHNNQEASYLAMEYAISKGADVLNFSWGSDRIDTEMRDYVELAWESGIIMFGGAGNDGVEDEFYPANYHDVISVAGTDRYDHMADFSNYGDWIELSAPGVLIWSTIPFNTFDGWDGTSFASPVAAGVAALIISAFPDSSNQWVRERILVTADTIDHLNPGYAGKIGSGRVNALKAIGPIRYPWLNFESYTVSDEVYGDGNGRVDPGEEGEIVFSFANLPDWQTATNVKIVISSSDYGITITDSISSIPDIMPGASASNEAEPVRFLMNPDAWAHYATITFTVSTVEGFSLSDDITFMIGRPDILVYDADGGDYFQEYYFNPLQFGELVFDSWDRNDLGPMPGEEFNLYKTVIYFTGSISENTVPAEEQTLLIDFLELGERSLLISGQYIGDEVGTTGFFTDYLNATHTDDNLPSGWGFNIVGIPGNPISDGLEISTLGGSGNQVSLSGTSPGAGATGFLRYNSDANPTRFAAIQYHNTTYDYKTAYFGFGLEGIGNTYGDSLRILLFRTLEWFGYTPGIDNEHSIKPAEFSLINYPNPFNTHTFVKYTIGDVGNEPIPVTIKVFDLTGSEITTLFAGAKKPGTYVLSWNASDTDIVRAPSGMYFIKMSTDYQEIVHRVILLK